jgi:hypothetical protein
MLSVVVLSVVVLSVVMLSVVMLSVIMLSVVMLSVVMLSVVMLSVVMLRVAAPLVILASWQHCLYWQTLKESQSTNRKRFSDHNCIFNSNFFKTQNCRCLQESQTKCCNFFSFSFPFNGQSYKAFQSHIKF